MAARDLLKSLFPSLPITVQGSTIFGRLKANYRKKTGIHDRALERHNIDFVIASCALAQDAILVSNDSIFMEIRQIAPDLKLENWTV